MPQHPAPAVESAAERANLAIAAYLRSLPGQRASTVAQRAELHRLVGVWLAAVREQGVVLAA